MRKSVILLFSLFFFGVFVYSQNRPFITVWQWHYNGNTLAVPLHGTYDYYWEKTDDPGNNGSGTGIDLLSLDFSTSGQYRLEITPSGADPFHRFGGWNYGTPEDLMTVAQWGDIHWSTFREAFMGTENVQFATPDIPDLSNVTDMYRAFCSPFFSEIPNLNNWDVSNVTNMGEMFYLSFTFNQPLDNWDVSHVTNMSRMFGATFVFNQPLDTWDVSNVTDMSYMFYMADEFNQPLNMWDVSNVTNMEGMFSYAQKFNQPLNIWDVSNVTNMANLFLGANEFNQPLDTWDVSKVTNMEALFGEAYVFNQPLETWDISNVTNMSWMFAAAQAFNQPIGNWDVSNVIDMSYLFSGASSFNLPIESWDVSNVKDMTGMFQYNSTFDQSIANWDVSYVHWMDSMFYMNTKFNRPIHNWNVSNLRSGVGMFNYSVIDQNLGNWKLERMEDSLFFEYSAMSCENYSRSLKGWAQNPNISTNIGLYVAGLSFSPSVAADRDYLINEKGWRIYDDEQGDCVLGTEEVANPDFTFYPNPATDYIHINTTVSDSEIHIVNMLGQTIQITTPDTGQKIDIRNLKPGVYSVLLYHKDGSKSIQKLIKK